MIHQSVLSPRVEEATQSLVQNLLASEPFLQYLKAKNRLDTDLQAQALLNDLTRFQAGLCQTQTLSPLHQADLDALRSLQSQVRSNPVIADYTVKQQEAVKLLREINNEISQLLGMDFAILTNKSSC